MTDTPLVYQDAPLLSPLSCFLDFGDSFSSVSPSSPLEDFGSLGSPYYKWSDVDNYVSPMLSYKHGYPLFHPAPCDDLPEAARRIGTQIGDVGVVTEDGSFDPIFNIRLAADDPANRFGVPADFEQVVLRDDIRRRRSHPPGTVLSNMTRRKSFGTNGTEVKNSKPVGTLTLPDGALSWDLHSQQVFRDYALKHAQNWYAFVKDGLQRIIGDGDLYLITGVTKSTSWRIETLKHYSENVEVSLKPEAPHGIDGSQESESVSSSFNYGPHRLPGEESWKDNQTIFLRGFKVAVRPPSGGSYGESGTGVLSAYDSGERFAQPVCYAGTRPAVLEDMPSWVDAGPKNIFWLHGPAGAGKSAIAQMFAENCRTESRLGASFFFKRGHSKGNPGNGVKTRNTSNDGECLEDFSPNIFHPSDIINQYMFASVPDATVAVTHDDVWASVLNESDHEFPENDELIRRISNKFDIDSSSAGGVYLRANSPAEIPGGARHCTPSPNCGGETLVYAASTRLEAIFKTAKDDLQLLFEMCDLNAAYKTAPKDACTHGHTDIDAIQRHYASALQVAIEGGHSAIVWLLLSQHSPEVGHQVGIVRLRPENGANGNGDIDGGKILWLAGDHEDRAGDHTSGETL